MHIERITRAARAVMAHRRSDEHREPGHPFHHGRRTAHVALHLADLVETDGSAERDVLYTAALFHDAGKRKHLNLDAAVPIYDRRLAFERAVYAEIERSHRGGTVTVRRNTRRGGDP